MRVETPSSRIHFVPPHIGHFLDSSVTSRPTPVRLTPRARRSNDLAAGRRCACCGRRSGGGAGILREPANNEGCKQQQPRLDRAGVVDADFHRSPTPALAVEERQLTIAVGECVAFTPGTRWSQRQLVTGPA